MNSDSTDISKVDRVLRSNLKMRHLQMLVVLDEMKHIGRAAEFLSLTQPAVSKTLAEMEEALGFRLFERSSRGTLPTPYGQSFIRFAREVITNFERTRDEINAVIGGAAGRVRVGAMIVGIPTLLGPAVCMLKEHFPATTILVEEGDLARLLPSVRQGELDFVVGRLQGGYAAADLVTEELYSDPMCAVACPNHSLIKRGKCSWSDLLEYPMIVQQPWTPLRKRVNEALSPIGSVKDLIETSSFTNMLYYLENRYATALLGRSAAQYYENRGYLRIIDLAVPFSMAPLGIISSRDRKMNSSTQYLVDCVRQVAKLNSQSVN